MLLETKVKNIIIYSSVIFPIISFVIIFLAPDPVLQLSANEAGDTDDAIRNEALWLIASFYAPIVMAIFSFLFGRKDNNSIVVENVTHDADMAKTANRVALFVSVGILAIPTILYARDIQDANTHMVKYQTVVQALLSPIFMYFFNVGIKKGDFITKKE